VSANAEFVHVGAHADILASGRSVGPGERIPQSELTDEDQHLVDEGHIVDVASFGDAPSNAPDGIGEPEPTKAELQARARELDIDGRSKMSVDELRQVIADREAELLAVAGGESEG
jgi:hypothetical protein